MIGIDTNVLLRYIVRDDEGQYQKAHALINGSSLVLVTDTVIVETIWTLRGPRYGLDKDAQCEVISHLFEEPNIRFENGQAVWLALYAFRTSKPVNGKTADFADALIIAKAQLTIAALGEPFEGSYTFDKAAQSLTGAKKP